MLPRRDSYTEVFIRGRPTPEHDNSNLAKSSSFARQERNGPVFGPLKFSITSQVVENVAPFVDFVTSHGVTDRWQNESTPPPTHETPVLSPLGDRILNPRKFNSTGTVPSQMIFPQDDEIH